MLLTPSFGNAKSGINIIKRLISARGRKFRSKAFKLAAMHSVGQFGAGLLGEEGMKGISSLSFYRKLLKKVRL